MDVTTCVLLSLKNKAAAREGKSAISFAEAAGREVETEQTEFVEKFHQLIDFVWLTLCEFLGEDRAVEQEQFMHKLAECIPDLHP